MNTRWISLCLSSAIIRMFTVIVLFASVTWPKPGNGVDRKVNSKSAGSDSPIRLVLRSPKTVWHVGESNELTAFLENTSEKPYFVGREFFGFGVVSSFHYIDLKITNAVSGREVPSPRLSMNQQWSEGTTLPIKIAQEYVKLGRGMVHGLTVTGDWDLKPGRYDISAFYNELEAANWTAGDHNTLPWPVWTQPLVSNTIHVTVVPKFVSRGQRGTR